MCKISTEVKSKGDALCCREMQARGQPCNSKPAIVYGSKLSCVDRAIRLYFSLRLSRVIDVFPMLRTLIQFSLVFFILDLRVL